MSCWWAVAYEIILYNPPMILDTASTDYQKIANHHLYLAWRRLKILQAGSVRTLFTNSWPQQVRMATSWEMHSNCVVLPFVGLLDSPTPANQMVGSSFFRYQFSRRIVFVILKPVLHIEIHNQWSMVPTISASFVNYLTVFLSWIPCSACLSGDKLSHKFGRCQIYDIKKTPSQPENNTSWWLNQLICKTMC